jgi:ferric-dicitrate binding protein FerR (iron transport regulator)
MSALFSSPDPETALLRQARAWLVRLTSGTVTPADAQAFRAWCAASPEHARAFAETKRLWQALEPAARQAAQDDALQGQAGQRGRGAHGGSRTGRRAFLGGAVAAAAAYCAVRPPLGLWPSLSDLDADYRTATGEQRRIVASSGVVVEMNTQTTMNVRQAGSDTGIELLRGEAEIDVLDASRTAVRVLAGGGRITAEQARVNVRLDGGEVCVTCLQGAARVAVHDRLIELGRAQQVVYGGAAMATPVAVSADPATVTAWRQRELVFDDERLAKVVDEINRYRPGRLVLMNDGLGERKVQARFSLDQLADVIALIRDAYGAKVTALPGGVVLLS